MAVAKSIRLGNRDAFLVRPCDCNQVKVRTPGWRTLNRRDTPDEERFTLPALATKVWQPALRAKSLRPNDGPREIHERGPPARVWQCVWVI
jgi:hypothetical protein